MLIRKRIGLGCRLLSRNQSLPELMRALDKGECLGLVADHRDDAGVPIPFFKHDKLTTIVPARLALRFDCDLVPVRVERLENATDHKSRQNSWVRKPVLCTLVVMIPTRPY